MLSCNAHGCQTHAVRTMPQVAAASLNAARMVAWLGSLAGSGRMGVCCMAASEDVQKGTVRRGLEPARACFESWPGLPWLFQLSALHQVHFHCLGRLHIAAQHCCSPCMGDSLSKLHTLRVLQGIGCRKSCDLLHCLRDAGCRTSRGPVILHCKAQGLAHTPVNPSRTVLRGASFTRPSATWMP